MMNAIFKKNNWGIFFALFVSLLFTSYNANANCSRVIRIPLLALNSASNNSEGEVKQGDLSMKLIQLMNEFGEKHGCQFAFTQVPKARQWQLFESGESDILLLLTRVEKREEVGFFMPIFQLKPAIVSNKKFISGNLSLKKIQENKKINLILVRGFDYGDSYRAFVQKMEKEKRVSYEPDTFSVAKSMIYKEDAVTIMVPTIFEDVLTNEKIVSPLIGNVRYSEIVVWPWVDVGIYI